MSVVAHVSGVPLEEMLLLASGGGALWAAQVWISALVARASRTARRRRHGPNRKAM